MSSPDQLLQLQNWMSAQIQWKDLQCMHGAIRSPPPRRHCEQTVLLCTRRTEPKNKIHSPDWKNRPVSRTEQKRLKEKELMQLRSMRIVLNIVQPGWVVRSKLSSSDHFERTPEILRSKLQGDLERTWVWSETVLSALESDHRPLWSQLVWSWKPTSANGFDHDWFECNLVW